MSEAGASWSALLRGLCREADEAGAFSSASIERSPSGEMLVCEARGSAEPAAYRVELDEGKPWVSLVMKDRWLSESIESELMHTGDSLEELLEDELVDQGYEPSEGGGAPAVEHFRSEDLFFTFRSPLPVDVEEADDPVSAGTALRWLLAYEACFRQLGDMSADEDD